MGNPPSETKQAKVQRVCTLWTHDDNFSRDEIVFNADKFPELTTTPGTLLQIVAIASGTLSRNRASPSRNSEDSTERGKSANDARSIGQSKRSRRGSISVVIDENGSIIRERRDVDQQKAYVFVSRPLAADLRSKYINLQVSIAERIAKVFGFRNRTQVILAEADEDKHEAHHVELVFRDEYLSRADMWRVSICELSRRTVYRNQKILFMGTIKASIKNIYINGQSVDSGYFSPKTKPIFRSESAKYVLFIQMSREMWDFDAEGAGEIMFNKVVGGFLPELFKRWLKINARHLVTIILFTRMQYDGQSLLEQSHMATTDSNNEANLTSFRDYYRVVVSDMASGDWINILNQLKKEFRSFLREVSLVHKPAAYGGTRDGARDENDLIVAGRPSSASQGNILEAINMAAAQHAKDYIDRDLVHTGVSIIVVTPGTGVFEVNHNMLKLTTDTLIGSGIDIDLVCLSPMPLHSVPLFKYRNPSLAAQCKSESDKVDSQAIAAKVCEEEKTPRQGRPIFGSLPRTSTLQGDTSFRNKSSNRAAETVEDWKFAMPYWIDVSFWSGISEEILQLTKPRKGDKGNHQLHRKGGLFTLRCRLYELQMMGVADNDLGDISIPYLEEDATYPQPIYAPFEPDPAKGQLNAFPQNSPCRIAGSCSPLDHGNRGHDRFDETTAAHRAWMEAYDNELFSPPNDQLTSKNQMRLLQRKSSYQASSYTPYFSRGLYPSAFVHNRNSSYDRTAESPSEVDFHLLMKEQITTSMDRSARSNDAQESPESGHVSTRLDKLRQQKVVLKTAMESKGPSHRRRGGSKDLERHQRSIRSTPRQSPVPSRGSSPLRPRAITPTSETVSPMMKSDMKDRPSNWFLRQISLGGKAAVASPTIANATIDISQGKVKPAMLTVEKNQKGAIAERLASSRLAIVEKPSLPIAIRIASRAGPLSEGSLSSDRGGSSVEVAKGLQHDQTSTPPQPSMMMRDPGSTFLLAGTRTLNELVGPKPDLFSTSAGREISKTLSPTSAIAPWAVLVNPCNPKKNSMDSQNQFRQWHHVFPRTLRTGSVRWKSLCSPAAVPLTHEWFPSAEQIATEYNENPYKIIQNDEDEATDSGKSRELLMKELIALRLSHGFQIVVGSSVADFSRRQEKSLASILASDYMSTDGDTIFMSVGSNIHRLLCVAGGGVEVKRYTRKPPAALNLSTGFDTSLPYKAYIRTAMEKSYNSRSITIRPPQLNHNWNMIDNFLAGYQEEMSEVLRYWRARFVLIPVEMPTIHRRPLPMLAEDSEEEVRLEGIRKLTQLWQKNRYISADERSAQPPTATNKQKDPNPLAIEYYTRDPSAVVAAGSHQSLFGDGNKLPSSIFSNSEQYHKYNMDIKKLAEHLQGEKGIPMIDRRWHWRLYPMCFIGFDLVTWLLANFKDIQTRDEAVELGNDLMNKGLFQHVSRRHHFRDGNFFFQMAPEHRTPRSETRMSWFGKRKSDKSVPATPMTEAPRLMPLIPTSTKQRPNTADALSTQPDAVPEGEKTPTRANSPRRQVTLSRVIRYDVDARKRSYRPEIVSLHYDCLHNPENCYHIRIDWMNVTAKLIEDAVVTWAASVEKYGLKLVEVPIAEVAEIVDSHPFRSPYKIKLAVQPPEPQSEAVWDLAHLSPQFSKCDKFVYHKALLRKLDFVLDLEGASAFPSDVDVTYSWGKLDYKHHQFIHRSGVLLAQITDDGNLLLLANRRANNRTKDSGRIRQADPLEHKKVVTDGSQSSRIPPSPAERVNPHRSPFASPITRPVQDTSTLHSTLALQEKAAALTTQNTTPAPVTPEQITEKIEEFCSKADLLSAFYQEAFQQAPFPWPHMVDLPDDKIPSLGLPPAVVTRETSPATSSWSLSSTFSGRSERAGITSGAPDVNLLPLSSLPGRRHVSEESTSTLRLGRRGSLLDITENLPNRQHSQAGSDSGV